LLGAGENAGQAAAGATPPAGKGRRNVILVAAVALLVIAGGLTWAFASSHSGTAAASVKSHPAKPVAPLHVVSVSPAANSHQVDGGARITVQYSAPLAANSPTPMLSPAIKGTWAPVMTKAKGKTKAQATSTMAFTPATGFQPHTSVKITIPAGPDGVRSTAGGQLTSEVTSKFRTGAYSTLRLQQLLAQLGYLPLTWSATGSNPAASDAQGQLSAAYSPPAGTFSWQSGYPHILHSMWQQGADNMIDVGAIRAFESVRGMTMDGVAGPTVWKDLLRAVAKGEDNPNGYSYALASKGTPETLTVWHNGHVVLHTLANTGIPAAPTADGTYPVYEKLPYQVMKGTNPDGSKYADPVYNVSYFHGGDALHFFDRASYGWQQSLGCVELPMAASATSYKYMTYGSLVTVSPS
jgi:peptidoglycan hydrolase-like protein with peptidoglycan-binding domain